MNIFRINRKKKTRKRFVVLGLLALGCVVVMGPKLQPNIDVNNLHCFVSALFDGSVTVGSVNGIDYTPGSDTDTDLITVTVDGTPTVGWDESEDGFVATHNVQAPEVAQTIEVSFSNTDDGSSGSGVSVPASANIIDIHLLATTDFTSGGTPTIDIGFTGDKDELVDGIDIDTQTNILLPPPTASIDKWAACTGGDIFVTCTTCTAGAGTIRIIYVID